MRRTVAARIDGLLTAERLTVYPSLLIAAFFIVWPISLVAGGATFLPDFLARWTAGRMLRDGRADVLYDTAAQAAVQQPIAADDSLSWFVSPPPVALGMTPLGLLPYPMAAAIWLILSAGALIAAARLAAGVHPALRSLASWRGALIAVASLPVLELVGGGQDTAFFALALAAAARLVATDRDVAAGLVLAVFVGKPQLGVLLPLTLLAVSRLRALVGLVAGVIGCVGLSVLVLGPRVWLDWLDVVISPHYRELVSEDQGWKMVTIRGLLSQLAPPVFPPWVVLSTWAVIAVALTAAFVVVLRRLGPRALPVILVGYLPLLTLLITAHAPVYELVLAIPTASLAVTALSTARVRVLVLLAFVLAHLAPILHLLGGQDWPRSLLGAPWVVLPLTMIWVTVSRRIALAAALDSCREPPIQPRAT